MSTKMQTLEGLSDTLPVSAAKTYGFSITLNEFQGRAHINWNVTYPARVRLAVAIYSGSQPTNPQQWINAMEVTNQASGTWDSGQPWGTGYSASLLGVNASSKAWVYIGIDTPETS